MPKVKETSFVCSNCGNEFSRWFGQCPSCKEWNSLKEVKRSMMPGGGKNTGVSRRGPLEKATVVNLGKIEGSKVDQESHILSSNIREFDRVLGKGIVRGSAVLFSGEPGIGKSTLLTQLIGTVGGLYVAGEESAEQIRLRVLRLGLDPNKFDILGTNSIDEIVEFLDRTQNLYKIAIVDSIQVMSSSNVNAVAGSVSQIRESTFRLIELAKKTGVAIFIVGHVTKEGDIAGPKLLEHMVDTVLYFEGERNGDLRILRSTKNRFGPTDEVGVFRMEEKGLKEVRSEDINLTEGDEGKVGAATAVVLEGTRPMLLEVQALITESFAPMPKRVFSGVDYNRGQLLAAIAQKSLGIPLYKYDVFIAVTGGIRVEDTGADCAVLAAMWSSFQEIPLPKDAVFAGEASLLGDVRKVRGMDRRKKEAESLGKRLIDIKNIRELKSIGKNKVMARAEKG
ncbi:MAG TPA: DNA repair protein RadA [Patescibacteria group bacterium]